MNKGGKNEPNRHIYGLCSSENLLLFLLKTERYGFSNYILKTNLSTNLLPRVNSPHLTFASTFALILVV